LKSLFIYVLDENNALSDELLYGRAGYLSGLLYVNSNIFPEPIEADLIKKVFKNFIKNVINNFIYKKCMLILFFN